jgi:hypothetical protein
MKRLFLGLSFALFFFVGCTQVATPEATLDLEEQGIVYDWMDRSKNRGTVERSGYASDLPWARALNSLGPVERNMTNGGRAANDGGALPRTYDKGLGVYGNSRITYLLPGDCIVLTTEAGRLDPSASPDAKMLFRIYADGVLVSENDSSGFALRREIGLDGVRNLTFITKDLNPSAANKSANWLNTYIGCGRF